MNTPMKSASDIITNVTQAVWNKMGKNDNNPPQITPDGIRQWITQITNDDYRKLIHLVDAHIDSETQPRQMPQDSEPNNWQAITWYRIKRCRIQHAIDIPRQIIEVTESIDISHHFNLERGTITHPQVIDKIKNTEEIKPRTIIETAFIAILYVWNNEQNLSYFKENDGIGSLEDGVVAIHNLWAAVDKKHKNEFHHPIGSIIEAYLQEMTAKHISAEYDRKHPVMTLHPPSMGSLRDMILTPEVNGIEYLGELKGVNSPAPESSQLNLSKIETVSSLPAVLPLQAVNMIEGIETTKDGAVAMPIRLFFEALMALEPKETQANLRFTLGDLLQYLNPNGKYNRTSHLPYVIKGLHALYWLRIPYRTNPDKPTTEVDWIPVLPRTVPNLQSGDDASIILEVKLPPDAKQGMLVEKDVLRHTGKYSSTRFNAYLTACWIFDKYGTQGGGIIDPTKPIERRDTDGYLTTADGQRIFNNSGKPIKNLYHKKAVATLERKKNEARNRYPILSYDDLTRACFPKGFPVRLRATYQKRALQAWEKLEDDRFIRLEKQSSGWRVMPSESHIGYYRALKKSVY